MVELKLSGFIFAYILLPEETSERFYGVLNKCTEEASKRQELQLILHRHRLLESMCIVILVAAQIRNKSLKLIQSLSYRNIRSAKVYYRVVGEPKSTVFRLIGRSGTRQYLITAAMSFNSKNSMALLICMFLMFYLDFFLFCFFFCIWLRGWGGYRIGMVR